MSETDLFESGPLAMFNKIYKEHYDEKGFTIDDKPFISRSERFHNLDLWPIDPRVSYIPEDDMYYIKDDMLKDAPDAKCHIALVVEDVVCFNPQYETTNILTEDGLIEFLEKIFGNENELEGE